MAENKPPEWDQSDPLAAFFADAQYNERVSALNLASVYKILQTVHSLFRRIEDGVEKDNRADMLVPRFLMVRVHSSFLAGIRLAMSGQISECFPVLRAGVEQAWYALHIAKDPNSPKRAEIWLNRNEGEAEKRSCKNEFTVARVRMTHDTANTNTAKSLHQIYESLIDFGAHPNQFGVLTSMTKSEIAEQTTFSVGILGPRPLPMAFALRMAVGAALGEMKIFQQIFPERFMLLGIDREIESLLADANALFRSFAPKAAR